MQVPWKPNGPRTRRLSQSVVGGKIMSLKLTRDELLGLLQAMDSAKKLGTSLELYLYRDYDEETDTHKETLRINVMPSLVRIHTS